jgi:hypothetical protein
LPLASICCHSAVPTLVSVCSMRRRIFSPLDSRRCA